MKMLWLMVRRVSFFVTRVGMKIDSPSLFTFGGWMEGTADDRLRSSR